MIKFIEKSSLYIYKLSNGFVTTDIIEKGKMEISHYNEYFTFIESIIISNSKLVRDDKHFVELDSIFINCYEKNYKISFNSNKIQLEVDLRNSIILKYDNHTYLTHSVWDKEYQILGNKFKNIKGFKTFSKYKNQTIKNIFYPKSALIIFCSRDLSLNAIFFINVFDLLQDEKLWEKRLDGRLMEKIFIDNYIIFSTRSNESMPSEQTRSLYCIKVETGEIQWFKYNFHVYDLLNESSDTVIVHSHDTTYRIDVHTGSVILSKENTTDVLSSIRPFFVDDEGVLFVGRSNNMVDNRFGRLNKNTFDIDWMYYYEIEGNKNLSLKDMILLADGRYLMRNGLKGEEKLFIFDPDDPENIPYRGISNGEVTGYTNLN